MGARDLGTSILLVVVVVACGTPEPSGSAGVSNASASPGITLPPATPMPSAAASALPIPSATPEEAALFIWVIYASDLGAGGDPGTAILADGRVIWSESFDHVVESELAPEAMQHLRDQIDATGVFDADGEYYAELRPGAQPPGHGLNSYRFEVVRDGRHVVVSSQDPRSFAGEERFWIISPEMRVLAALADRLEDPVAGLGSDAFEAAVRPYRPNRYLVRILLSEQRGDGNYRADDVRWPFGEPIERAGEPYDLHDENWTARCLLIDATMAMRMAAAEDVVGADRDLTRPLTVVDYDSSTGGSISVSVNALLPHESGTCVELAATAR